MIIAFLFFILIYSFAPFLESILFPLLSHLVCQVFII